MLEIHIQYHHRYSIRILCFGTVVTGSSIISCKMGTEKLSLAQISGHESSEWSLCKHSHIHHNETGATSHEKVWRKRTFECNTRLKRMIWTNLTSALHRLSSSPSDNLLFHPLGSIICLQGLGYGGGAPASAQPALSVQAQGEVAMSGMPSFVFRILTL